MIEFKNIAKVYKGGKVAVEDINLTIESGEFVCFIGTSGSGKTTSMRMINRMLTPTSGEVLIDGKNVMSEDAVALRRKIGYVIQQIGLMPHMTIKDNITLVPKLLKKSPQERDEIAKRLIKYVELPETFLERYPSELSGGQQQRIGVLRALAADQDIILMDEPFGALDPITREALQDLVKDLQSRLGKTIVFVTHDMDEALKLASRIVIMDNGHIIQNDTPDNILRAPANEFVEELIGRDRLIQSRPNITTVGQVMLKTQIYITPEKSLGEAVRLMRDKRVDTLLVVDDTLVLKGYVDIETIDFNRGHATSIGDILDKKVFYVHEDSLLRDTVQRILKRGLKYAPVVDQKKRLVGIVTRAALVDIVYDTIWGVEDDGDTKNTDQPSEPTETKTEPTSSSKEV